MDRGRVKADQMFAGKRGFCGLGISAMRRGVRSANVDADENVVG